MTRQTMQFSQIKRMGTLCLMLVASLLAYGQTELRGVDFTAHHFSAVDSAVLRRNSIMYSGKSAYGTETDGNLTVFPKWLQDKEKYYPVMREAWLYCMNHAPYQLRLYKDGVLFYQWMIEAAEDSVNRAHYVDEVMQLYDQQIQNLDSINAHVKRFSDRTSVGNMLLHKAFTYDYYVLGPEEGGTYAYTEKKAAERKRLMYPMYKEAVDVIKKAIEDGDELGGDVRTFYLNRFFVLAYWHAVDSINQYSNAKDSIGKRKFADAKAQILNEYNFIKDFCEVQMHEQGQDYVDNSALDTDTLSDAMRDSLRVVQQQVIKPYTDLMAGCDTYMRFLEPVGVYVLSQTLEDAWANFNGELESHKDSVAWLNRVRITCENTQDFLSGSEYYSFYEKVVQYLEAAKEKARPTVATGTRKQEKKGEIDPNQAAASRLLGQLRGSGITSATAPKYALFFYYVNKALRTNPGNRTCLNWKNYYLSQPAFRSDMFFAGVREGQTITVNGVTFKVVLR